MGLSRARRAPTELDDDQKKKVRDNPLLVALREEREAYKYQLYDKGFYPLPKAEGTPPYKKIKETDRKIGSTSQKLHRDRSDQTLLEFHDSIDTIEIARQLSGKAATEVLTLPSIEVEIRE